MNKLRKAPPDTAVPIKSTFPNLSVSLTTQQALASLERPWSKSRLEVKLRHNATTRPTPSEAAVSVQYWATRALLAESLLTAREDHHRELRDTTLWEEEKRSKELDLQAKAHEVVYARFERLLGIFLICIIILVFSMAYLSAGLSRRYTATPQRLPSHFTVPILSPFTSVVEHETSVIGTKTIVLALSVAAVLSLVMFRYWLKHSYARAIIT